MAQKSILHVCTLDKFTKFIPAYVEFVKKRLEFEQHVFLLLGDTKLPIPLGTHVIQLSSRTKVFTFLIAIIKAKKIILHGLFVPEVVALLAIQSWLLKKCYWVIWGGDLYDYQDRSRGIKADLYEMIRAFVIRRMGHFVTYIRGDYELARKWYRAKGQYHECIMYPSNLYKQYAIPAKSGTTINVLVGNSADSSNDHINVFEQLLPFKGSDVLIFCPLSYGELGAYLSKVLKIGKEMFGDKFIPLLEFLPFQKYLELLGQIDIAVFAHKHQQAMGNTITLLGLGKKVYMRNDVTPWTMLQSLGVKVFDVRQIDLMPLGDDVRKNNQTRIKSIFSEVVLAKQWKDICED